MVSVFFTNNAEKQDADDKFDLNPSHAALYVSTDSVLKVFLDPYCIGLTLSGILLEIFSQLTFETD